MKTLKALRIAAVLNGIYCLCCIAYAICLTLYQHIHSPVIKTIGVITGLGWLLNPSPVIAFVMCRVRYSAERRSPEARQLIGKKYVWIYLWPVIAAACYFAAMGTLIEITGGV